MADDSQPLPTDFDERFSDVYNRFTVPGQDTPLYTPKSSVIDFKKPTVKERFGGLPTEGPPEAFYTPPIERGKGGTLVEVPKKLREGNYELTPVEGNIAPGSLREVLFGYDKPVGRFQSWPERLARIVGKGAFNIVEAIPGGVTAPYEAYKGRLQVTDPVTGMPTEEAIQRSIAALSLPGGAGVIGGAEKGAVAGSGMVRRNTNDQWTLSAPGYKTDNYYYLSNKDLAKGGLQSAYDASHLILKMIDRTVRGDEGIETAPLPKKGGKSYEEMEVESHRKLITQMEQLAKKFDIPLKKNPTPKDFLALEDRLNAIAINAHAEGHWKSNIFESANTSSERFLPNGVLKPEAFDRVLPAVRNLETGKISTTKRGNEHADILTRLWEREGGSPHADTMSIYEDMLPRHEMGYYDPLKKQFHKRDSEEWRNIDSPDLNPRQAMRADQVFSDTSKQAQLLSSLTASQRKAYNREAFRNGGQMLVPESSEEAIRKLVEEPAYKKWEKAASDAGFTTDAYHGTSNFEGSTIEPKRSGKTEFYSTDEPKLAEDYSGKSGGVLPLKLNTSNYHVVDAHGKSWDQINEQVIKTAKEQGNSGVTIKNLRDSHADREVEPATVHITFDPSTVRSRFAKFNPEDVKKNGLLLSETSKPAAMLAPAFHSAVENAVNNAKIKTGTPEQWLGYLKNQQGVKQEELDWIRPQDVPTNEKGQISKEAMQDYVNSHKVELKEVNKKAINNKYPYVNSFDWEAAIRRAERAGNYTEAENINHAWEEQQGVGPQGSTKYSQYQLPGGENYREMLLTLPEKTTNKTVGELAEERGLNWGNANPRQREEILNGDNYRSSHWDEPNVLAHIRMNDRNIPGVGKSLHLEEIQSDWHQTGRERGYKQSNEQIEKYKNRLNQIKDELANPNTSKERQVELYKEHEQIVDKYNQHHDAIPNAPFKKTWSDLALKRMIREASEKGYDAVSWTPGEAQASRYDLSKQVSQIEYNPENGHLIVRDPNRNNVINKSVTKDELKNTIGKELSDKLLNSKLNKNDNHELSGLDLKVGGEGMKGFYDKMLVDKMNNLAKKYGGKVEQSNLPSKVMQAGPEDWRIIGDDGKGLLKANGDPLSFKTKEEALNHPGAREVGKVHVLKLPQSMKDAALQKGFPLFSKTGHILTPTSNPYINNENDVPYGAGASDTKSGYPVHIDKRIPSTDPKLTLPSGEPANLHSYLQVHEITEHQLMKRGMSYEQAHKKATEREKAAVERDGVSWDEYSHIMSGYLKETEKEKVDNPPPNLYKRPYAHDRKELKKLEK